MSPCSGTHTPWHTMCVTPHRELQCCAVRCVFVLVCISHRFGYLPLRYMHPVDSMSILATQLCMGRSNSVGLGDGGVLQICFVNRAQTVNTLDKNNDVGV